MREIVLVSRDNELCKRIKGSAEDIMIKIPFVVSTEDEAVSLLYQKNVKLMLLDLGTTGWEVWNRLTNLRYILSGVEIVFIIRSMDSKELQKLQVYGPMDILMMPLEGVRIKKMLMKYRIRKNFAETTNYLSQRELDMYQLGG